MMNINKMKTITKRMLSALLAAVLIVLAASNVFAAQEASLDFGTMDFYDSKAEDNVYTDSFCYFDDWFFEDPAEQNDRLALASMQLVAAASDADANGLAAEYLKKLGFTTTGVGRYDAEDPYDCVYVWGKKTIGEGADAATLVAVAMQSFAFDDETKLTGWKQNFGINGETITDEHDSFRKAVNNIIDDVAALGGSGKVKYWITGQSRGGALAGMLSAKLPSQLSGADIFAYTFEAPAQVGGALAEQAPSYSYIHNYISTDDIVTMIPPWDMVRYGVDHVLNTEEIDEGLLEQLERLGVKDPYIPYADVAGMAKKILGVIGEEVPTREDYSAEHTDVFKDSKGKQISVTYVWQDLFQKLMEIIFGDGLSGINMEAVQSNMASLAPAIQSLAKALKNDSNPDYYEAAKSVKAFLKENKIALPLEEAELYALLKLAAPLLVDSSYEPQSDPLSGEDMLNYVSPLLDLYISRSALTFSHQFINIIARLHALAGDPMLESLDLTINDPAAGDASVKAPAELKDAVNALENSWMKASAKWVKADEPLKDGKVYYLDVTLEATGHRVPDDFTMKLNGKDPVDPLTVSYQKGTVTVGARYAFTIGTPKKITISFDTQGKIKNPKAQTADCGERLKYAISPEDFGIVTKDNESWRLLGWYDKEGTFWEDVYAEEDLTLTAKWIRRIGRAEVSYTIPNIGEKLGAPTVPEGAPYKILSWYVVNDNWDEVTSVESVETLFLHFTLVPVDDSLEFATEINEDGELVFSGKVLFNGKEVSVSYSEDEGGLTGEFEFTPTEEEVTEPEDPTKQEEPTEPQDPDETKDSDETKAPTEPEDPDETKKPAATKQQKATTHQQTTKRPTTAQKTTKKIANTGDESSTVVWWILLSAAFAGALITIGKVRRSKE